MSRLSILILLIGTFSLSPVSCRTSKSVSDFRSVAATTDLQGYRSGKIHLIEDIYTPRISNLSLTTSPMELELSSAQIDSPLIHVARRDIQISHGDTISKLAQVSQVSHRHTHSTQSSQPALSTNISLFLTQTLLLVLFGVFLYLIGQYAHKIIAFFSDRF